MKCLHPNIINGVKYPCCKCEACTANKTNEYILRFYATARHKYAYFVTLTYEDAYLPRFGVSKLDVKTFLQKLEEQIGKFKYVAIAEYGGRFCRPHYHLNIFTDKPILLPYKTIDTAWDYKGRTQIKLNRDKELNYIAKYHSTEILSRHIYQYEDYPAYIRLGDCKDAQDMFKKMSKRLNKPLAAITAGLQECAESFRFTSRGIGEERLEENSFKQMIRNKQFYEINNKGRRSALPNYYKNKLSLDDQIACNHAQVDYLFDRDQNDIDRAVISTGDYEGVHKFYQEEWRKNYEDSVIKRKKHQQSTL